MPFLYVRNLTDRQLGFDSVLQRIDAKAVKVIAITAHQVEKLSNSLVAFEQDGYIEYDVFNNPDQIFDDTEYVTLEDIKALISTATGNVTSGTYILKPNATTVYPDSIVFSNWNSLYAQYILDGGGGFIVLDGSLNGGLVPLLPGSFDLSDAILIGANDTKPIVSVPNGFSLSKPTLRTRNVQLQFNTSSTVIDVINTDSNINLIDSTIQMLSTGDLINKQAGTGTLDIKLTNSSFLSSSGHILNVDAGELVSLYAFNDSYYQDDVFSGGGDIDAYIDASVDTSTTQPNHLGVLTNILIDDADRVGYDDTLVAPPLGANTVQEAIDALKGGVATFRAIGVELIGIKDGSNRDFQTPDKFVHVLGGDTITIMHNGRVLQQSSVPNPVFGEYYVYESGGVGTGYDSVHFLSFIPVNISILLSSYTIA